jgi:hypothetical protein
MMLDDTDKAKSDGEEIWAITCSWRESALYTLAGSHLVKGGVYVVFMS